MTAKKVLFYLLTVIFCLLPADNVYSEKKSISNPSHDKDVRSIAKLTQGWQGVIIAKTDQNYVDRDVEIGDADNDGKNEIVIAAGAGHREKTGTSYVVIVEQK